MRPETKQTIEDTLHARLGEGEIQWLDEKSDIPCGVFMPPERYYISRSIMFTINTNYMKSPTSMHELEIVDLEKAFTIKHIDPTYITAYRTNTMLEPTSYINSHAGEEEYPAPVRAESVGYQDEEETDPSEDPENSEALKQLVPRLNSLQSVSQNGGVAIEWGHNVVSIMGDDDAWVYVEEDWINNKAVYDIFYANALFKKCENIEDVVNFIDKYFSNVPISPVRVRTESLVDKMLQ